MNVADLLAEFMQRHGAHHAFGVGGANIEDVFLAVQRRRPALRAVLCKHEHGAGTAADAHARLRDFGVVMVTSGGGAMNLVHSLAEARASRVPILAIVGEPPTQQQGQGAFQDTRGQRGRSRRVSRAHAGVHAAQPSSAAAALAGAAVRHTARALGRPARAARAEGRAAG